MATRLGRMAGTLAAVLIAATLVSCGAPDTDDEGDEQAANETPAAGGTLHLADQNEAISLNPYEAQDNNSQRVFAQVIEPLYRTDADGEVVPWLATGSTPSKDFTEWTIDLREGVTFHNGDPMTAEDVVWSLDQVRKSPGWMGMLSEIDKVEVASPTSILITTTAPAPTLDVSLSLPFAAIVPKDLGGLSSDEFAESPIGTGPFIVDSWSRGQEITLVRNEDYWDPERPYLDKVVIHAVASDSSRTQQLRSGELDMIASPPDPQLEALDAAPTTRVQDFALAIPNLVLVNQRSKVFTDPRVREAVEIGIDREAILEATSSGYGEVGRSWFTPSLKYYDESLTAVERDPERAEKLLAEAVADTGIEPEFTLKISSGDSYATLASQIIKQNLEDVGFSVTITPLDASAALSDVAGGKYDASLFGITSDIVEPSEIVGFYLDLDALWTGGETDEVARLLKQAKRESDEAKRADLYAQIQEVTAEDRSLITLDYQPWIWASADDVVGFALAPTGVPRLADVGFRAK